LISVLGLGQRPYTSAQLIPNLREPKGILMPVSLSTLQDDAWDRSKMAVFALPIPNQPCGYMCVRTAASDERQAS
jgi:hypothetical protein